MRLALGLFIASICFAQPNISYISPYSGAVGSTVSIYWPHGTDGGGTGFGAARGMSTVKFNGTAVSTYTSWTATKIVVVVPSGATSGPIVVNVSSMNSNGFPFVVTPAPHGTLNNQSFIPPGGPITKARSAEIKMGDTVNVMDFGAKCDGTTNDTAAFTAALQTFGTNQTLLLPAATCVANVTLGSTQGLSCVTFTHNQGFVGAAGPCILKDASSGASPTITVSAGAFNWTVSYITLIGHGSLTTDIGILSTNSANGIVDHVTCDNFGASCIEWDAGAAISVSHVLAANILLNREISNWSAHTGGIWIGGTDGYFEFNEINVGLQLDGHSLSANCYSDAFVINGANHFFNSNIGEYSELGYYYNATQTRSVNDRADNNYCSGEWNNGSGLQSTNFMLLRNSNDGASSWDALHITGTNNTYTNLTIDMTSSMNTLLYGISDVSSAADTNFNTFCGVRFFNVTQATWYNVTMGEPEFCGVEKFPILIPDTTTTPNLYGHSSFYFGQSTTLEIDNLTGAYGQRVCFTGNHNVTFGVIGNIGTPYGINQPLQDGFEYCYINNGNGGITHWQAINTDNINTSHIIGSLCSTTSTICSNQPSIAPGTGAGTGAGSAPVVTLYGNDITGWVQVVTGTKVPATFNIIFTITWLNSYGGIGAACNFTAMNNSAAGVVGLFSAATGSGTYALTATTPALATSTTYQWQYICAQNSHN